MKKTWTDGLVVVTGVIKDGSYVDPADKTIRQGDKFVIDLTVIMDGRDIAEGLNNLQISYYEACLINEGISL